MVLLRRHETGSERDAVKKLLKDNPELCEELEAKIMQAITDKKD